MTIVLSIEAVIGLAGLLFTIFCTIVGLLYAIFQKLANIEKNYVAHVVCEKRRNEVKRDTEKILKITGVLGFGIVLASLAMLVSGCSVI